MSNAEQGTAFRLMVETPLEPSKMLRPEILAAAHARGEELFKPWKIIDAAPKDGTRILAFDGSQMKVTHWHASGRFAYDQIPNTEIYRRVLIGWWSNPEGGPFTPTHWMPLPSPPTAAE